MYINPSKAIELLKKVEQEVANKANLETLQKAEDTIRAIKTSAAIEVFAKKNQFTLDSFIELLADILNVSKYEVEYYYFITRKYGYGKEITEKKKAFLTLIGDANDPNYNSRPCSYSRIMIEIERLMNEDMNFLFFGTDDDTFLTDIVRTEDEILLPYGNPIKIVRGHHSESFESNIRLACDSSNALGFPVTLKLRP